MKTKLGLVAIIVLLLFYIWVAFDRAFLLIRASEPLAKIFGFALLVIPIVVLWALIAELHFGMRTKKLADDLEKRNLLPVDDLPRTPGGRIIKEAADSRFTEFKTQVEERPESWEAWFNLSCGYDMASDRTRARKAMRKAIELYDAGVRLN
ncbi:MAG: hypothetical protein QM613_00690 [Micrococcaceae bacterium]